MRYLIIILFLFLIGCSNPIGTDSKSNKTSATNGATIILTFTNSNQESYNYKRIWYSDKTLNIDLVEGCGVSIPIESIYYFETD